MSAYMLNRALDLIYTSLLAPSGNPSSEPAPTPDLGNEPVLVTPADGGASVHYLDPWSRRVPESAQGNAEPNAGGAEEAPSGAAPPAHGTHRKDAA